MAEQLVVWVYSIVPSSFVTDFQFGETSLVAAAVDTADVSEVRVGASACSAAPWATAPIAL